MFWIEIVNCFFFQLYIYFIQFSSTVSEISD